MVLLGNARVSNRNRVAPGSGYDTGGRVVFDDRDEC
jgi:hypothetical protein